MNGQNSRSQLSLTPVTADNERRLGIIWSARTAVGIGNVTTPAKIEKLFMS